MPAVDPVLPKAKAKKPVKVRVTVPDAHEETRTRAPQPTGKVRMYAHPYRANPQKVMRQQVAQEQQQKAERKAVKKAVAKIHVTPVPSPDARDSTRSPAQQAHDKAFVAQTVKTQRVKALREQNAGSGTRAVKAFVKSNIADEKQAKTTDIHGHSGSGPFAVITANLPIAGFSTKMLANAGKDAAELAVTTPSSVAKLASTAVHDPKKVPKLLAQPYIDFAKHPLKTAEEKPVSTALMVAPAGRVPGRVVGRVARKAGKQTLERPAATLPGTALQEARIGSRDAAVRHAQARHDAKHPTPEVTAKEVQTRVDEHFDHAKHMSHRIVGEATKAARKMTKGQPKAVRVAAVEHAREVAQESARQLADERFAKEFGANVRLSHGVAVREALHKVRRQAVATLDTARAGAKAAEGAHDAALSAAKVARAKVKASPKLAALEAQRGVAVKGLVKAQKAASTARAAHAQAIGRAQILSRNVTGYSTPNASGVWAGGGHGVRLAKTQVEEAAQAVKGARDQVREFDRQIADERQRISGVPPAEAQALHNAIHARGQARVVLAAARADAHTAAHAHIAAKRAMTNASLVSPTSEGRLFAHKADAATVVKKLNQAAVATGAGEPATFVLRQVGEDRWAAVPKIAAKRLLKHQVVGSSPATMAKAMRVSRGAFTQATLPLSLKWLGGQASEAGVRSVLAGAGPMDWLRVGKVVKKLNAQKAGSGDELASRITGGHFDLVGPARDFANGKSLADEFADGPRRVATVARGATRAGQTLPAKAVRQGWGQYTRAVLGTINHVIESNARRAMAGQAIKDLGFQDQHILGLFDKAIEDAANGLKATHNQVALGRAVDRMYGKYSKFSPETRTLLMYWTPYLAWYMNSVKFLTQVLPFDHPVKVALVADASMAEEEWRKSHRLSLDGSHVPLYMMGSYPTKDGKYRNIAHYSPGGIGADPVGSLADLMLPQLLGPLKNMGGVDWKWQRLTHGGTHGKEFNMGEKSLRALVTAAEEQIPGVTQAGKISGVTPRYVDKNSPETIKSAGDVLRGYLPWTPMSNNEPTTGGGSSGRVKIPGVGSSGRVKIPGVTGGRVKIP